MIQYVHTHEPHLDLREEHIAFYLTMGMVDCTKEFFHQGIVTKTCNLKNWVILPEFRVVSSDIKIFPDIYMMFQFHKLERMDSSSGDYSNHLTNEFNPSYGSMLIKLHQSTNQQNTGRKMLLLH